MKLTKLTKATSDQILREIDVSLSVIAKRYGLKNLKVSRASWGEAVLNFSVKSTLDNDDSFAVVERQKHLSRMIGFQENIFGREMYATNGGKYKVVDINTRRSKYPIIGENALGHQLCFTKRVSFIPKS